MKSLRSAYFLLLLATLACTPERPRSSNPNPEEQPQKVLTAESLSGLAGFWVDPNDVMIVDAELKDNQLTYKVCGLDIYPVTGKYGVGLTEEYWPGIPSLKPCYPVAPDTDGLSGTIADAAMETSIKVTLIELNDREIEVRIRDQARNRGELRRYHAATDVQKAIARDVELDTRRNREARALAKNTKNPEDCKVRVSEEDQSFNVQAFISEYLPNQDLTCIRKFIHQGFRVTHLDPAWAESELEDSLLAQPNLELLKMLVEGAKLKLKHSLSEHLAAISTTGVYEIPDSRKPEIRYPAGFEYVETMRFFFSRQTKVSSEDILAPLGMVDVPSINLAFTLARPGAQATEALNARNGFQMLVMNWSGLGNQGITLAKKAIRLGANPNYVDEEQGANGILGNTLIYGNAELLDLLLKSGARPKQKVYAFIPNLEGAPTVLKADSLLSLAKKIRETTLPEIIQTRGYSRIKKYKTDYEKRLSELDEMIELLKSSQ